MDPPKSWKQRTVASVMSHAFPCPCVDLAFADRFPSGKGPGVFRGCSAYALTPKKGLTLRPMGILS